MLDRSVVIACLVGLAAGCSDGSDGSGCRDTQDCAPGEVCVEGGCVRLCRSNTDCSVGRVCGADNLCTEPTGQPPVITGLDGDGSADGQPGHSDHHIAHHLVITGSNLSNTTVDLVGQAVDFVGLEPAGTSSDVHIDLPLPAELVEGAYLVRVTNAAAGSDQTDATILQGEPGTALTGDEVIAKINEARTGGTLLVADRLGSISEASITSLTASVASLETLTANLPASPNLLVDSRLFRGIPADQTGLLTDAYYGPWHYHRYDDASASVTVEDPPQELLDLVQAGTPPWWPQDFKVLHLQFSPGGAKPGRVLQRLTASEKSGPATMSAWVRVEAGGVYLGQEVAWQLSTNSTWEKVEFTLDTPANTLGGVWGFAGQEGIFSNAYIALPKVEMSPVATPWLEAPWTPSWSDSLSVAKSAGANLTGTGYQQIPGSSKSVTIPAAGKILVNWSISHFAAAAGDFLVQVGLGAITAGEVQCYTNEGGSHKACSGTVILDGSAGTQTLELQVSVENGTFQMDGNDRIQWTAFLLP